jgi:ubiquinone/menaquinone biosynthesis C-methylase UbiE/uncharacterized protein YbaR (Trm112 family)
MIAHREKESSMTNTLLPILSCPVCRGNLKIRIDSAGNVRGPRGTLTCEGCKETYPVDNGIPKLYVDDDEVIERSGESKHPEYIIDGKRLEVLAKELRGSHIERKKRRYFYKRISVFAIAGWLLAAITPMLILAGSVGAGISWGLVSIVAVASSVVFLLDFLLYRASLNERHQYQLRRLIQLYKASSLSEFDIHEKQKGDQEEEEHGNPAEDAPKAAEISKRLDRYRGHGKKGLNVGCGGELHQLISQPFFDRGYEMVGVDIFDTYVEQYSKLFKIDAVQGNAMALPFKSNKFDIVNFCDIFEHLHHPYLGLREINRVLKTGGILILSTNYRCRLSRDCANPLILIERILSVFDDRVLGPRDMLREFRDMEFYHLDFSRQELVEIIESSGFEVVEFYTYLNNRRVLTNLFSRLPVLRFLGDAILITCRKRDYSTADFAPSRS